MGYLIPCLFLVILIPFRTTTIPYLVDALQHSSLFVVGLPFCLVWIPWYTILKRKGSVEYSIDKLNRDLFISRTVRPWEGATVVRRLVVTVFPNAIYALDT